MNKRTCIAADSVRHEPASGEMVRSTMPPNDREAILTAGGMAYWIDEDYNDNPYDAGTPEHGLWDMGWWRAMQEDGV